MSCGLAPPTWPWVGSARRPVRRCRIFVARDGFATVGDLAVVGPDGSIRIRGRGDTAVTTGGHTVLVEDVEAALAAIPGVRAVAVVGVPHARLGQLLTAVVELTVDAQLARCPEVGAPAAGRTGAPPRLASRRTATANRWRQDRPLPADRPPDRRRTIRAGRAVHIRTLSSSCPLPCRIAQTEPVIVTAQAHGHRHRRACLRLAHRHRSRRTVAHRSRNPDSGFGIADRRRHSGQLLRPGRGCSPGGRAGRRPGPSGGRGDRGPAVWLRAGRCAAGGIQGAGR